MGLLVMYVLKSYIQLWNRTGDYLESLTFDMLLFQTSRTVLGALPYGTYIVVTFLLPNSSFPLKTLSLRYAICKNKKEKMPVESGHHSNRKPEKYKTIKSRIMSLSVCTILGERIYIFNNKTPNQHNQLKI